MMESIFCRQCGKQLHASAMFCTQCGATTGGGAAAASVGLDGNPSHTDPALRFIVPIGRSGWAIAAGYLALFSLFLLPAPLALACGILALRDISQHPEKTGKPRAIFGIVVGVIGTVLLVMLLMR